MKRPLEAAAAFLAPKAFRIAGAGAGLLAGWFGLLAGFLLGYMVDVARSNSAARSRAAAYLRAPGEATLSEPVPGLSAAAALALRGDWGGEPDFAARRELFEGLVSAILPRPAEAGLDLAFEAAAEEPLDGTEGLERALAASGSPAARRLVADFAYALQDGLDHGREALIRRRLAACGLEAAEIARARSRRFPDYRDPWELLGLEPGATTEELKRAWRCLSRRCHPDSAEGGLDPEEASRRFRELHEAYEAALSALPATDRLD